MWFVDIFLSCSKLKKSNSTRVQRRKVLMSEMTEMISTLDLYGKVTPVLSHDCQVFWGIIKFHTWSKYKWEWYAGWHPSPHTITTKSNQMSMIICNHVIIYLKRLKCCLIKRSIPKEVWLNMLVTQLHTITVNHNHGDRITSHML